MFEIHITVECDLDRFSLFEKLCGLLNVKPLCITMLSGSLIHIMTSSIVRGTLQSALEEKNRICDSLVKDFTILREKIETNPSNVFENMLPHSYYEVHVEVDKLFFPTINSIPLQAKWYISDNIKKPDYSILTCRLVDWSHRTIIEDDILSLKELEVLPQYYNPIYEFAILDTNSDLDKDWMI